MTEKERILCIAADGAKPVKPVTLTVNLKGTKPAFKFNTTTVTLDAAYPGDSEASVKLLMDAGYTLEDITVVAPNDSVTDFIGVEKSTDGTVTFKVIKAGLSAAGVYTITPKVKTSLGECAELAEQKITVKVTNTSAVSLSSKSKSITINPNLGSTSANANVALKGFTKQDGVYYRTSYTAVPTNEAAKEAGMYFNVSSDGAINVSNMGECKDDKYTYSVVAAIEGSDGTVTYSKPLALTVQLKTKALTIVPSKKAVTVYADYCTTVTKDGKTYYQVTIPVSVKEAAKIEPYSGLANSMEAQGVLTRFEYDYGGQEAVP